MESPCAVPFTNSAGGTATMCCIANSTTRKYFYDHKQLSFERDFLHKLKKRSHLVLHNMHTAPQESTAHAVAFL